MTITDTEVTATPIASPAPTRRWRLWVAAAAPLIAALLVGSAAILWVGESPLEFFWLLVREAFGGVKRISATLVSSTPLILTGTATLIAFRAGVFNIGVEGSFVGGAFVAAIAGASLDLPGPIQIVVVLAIASIVGAAIGWGPGWLKARLDVDEVVVTLMGNFVVSGVVGWLLSEFFMAVGTGNAQTELIAPQTNLPVLVASTQLTIGILFAVVVVALAQWWLRSTVPGYELRMTGANPRFARAQGIDTARVIIWAMVISGLIGGLAGGVFTTGTLHRFVEGGGANLGFNGIAIALLARLNPIAIIPSAVVLGALSAAGPTVQLFIDVPLDIVRIMEGTIMIVAVLPLLTRSR
jgi:ABC-type uncharacterized transport system permease subunit